MPPLQWRKFQRGECIHISNFDGPAIWPLPLKSLKQILNQGVSNWQDDFMVAACMIVVRPSPSSIVWNDREEYIIESNDILRIP